MAFVQKAVARLHEPEKLETLLRELGKKHVTYGAKQKYVEDYRIERTLLTTQQQMTNFCRRDSPTDVKLEIQLVGPQFILAIKPSLEKQWDEELHEAWTHLFKIIEYIMVTSMDEEQKKIKNIKE